MNNLNYGVIGNCRSAALVSERASIEWCCLPDFDSPSVFAALLDPEIGGTFSFEVGESYTHSQKYFFRTNILCTLFTSIEGSFEVIDFMPRYKTSDNNYYASAEIYRYIRLRSGSPTFKIHYDPRLNLSLIHISEPTRRTPISYAVFC